MVWNHYEADDTLAYLSSLYKLRTLSLWWGAFWESFAFFVSVRTFSILYHLWGQLIRKLTNLNGPASRLAANWPTDWQVSRSPGWQAAERTHGSWCCVCWAQTMLTRDKLCLADGHWRRQYTEEWTKPEKGRVAITSPHFDSKGKGMLYFTEELSGFTTSDLLNYNEHLLSTPFHFSILVCHFLSLHHWTTLLF